MKKLSQNNKGLVAILFLAWFVFAFFIIWLVSLWTDRNLEFWLSHIKHKAVDVPDWLSFLLTLVLNAIALALNIIFEIARLFVS